MNRKLAVPLMLGRLWDHDENKMARCRTLKDADEEDLCMLMKLADNRVRLEKLMRDIESDSMLDDSDEMRTELDYINASARLGILEITGELEEIQNSNEIFEEAVA